ncbi:hypothetical protein GQ53DRAFT_818158 [Thozetella sp. PMI_491]|nr:hypothetical protein GQ53DRAFT_818158 [Thozetella sp. PMI_491]
MEKTTDRYISVVTTVRLVEGLVQVDSLPGDVNTSISCEKLAPAGGQSKNLPPIEDVLPVVQDYFNNFNVILPLFDRSTFMDILDENWNSGGQDPAVRAAVNVIVALAYQHRATTRPPIPNFDPETCISNALSVASCLSKLSPGNNDLLRLETLLGLVFLYRGMPPPGISAAGSLMASAMKLAHKLRLHRSKTNALFDTESSLRRSRVFWVAYILDRDISLRTTDPPLQQENDYDIAVPLPAFGSGLVRFVTHSGSEVYFDVFQASIRLACIQSAIYDRVFSVRAESQPEEVRQRSLVEIHGMLRDWLAAIPEDLRPDGLSNLSAPKLGIRQLVSLYFGHLASALQAHKVGTHNAEWIVRLINYSQQIVGGAGQQAVSDSMMDYFMEPSSSWGGILSAARGCARLFRLVEQDDDPLVWNVSCTYESAGLVMMANTLTVSGRGHETGAETDEDAQLVAEVLAFLARIVVGRPDWHSLRRLHAAHCELSCRARIARAKFSLGPVGPKSAAVEWLEAEASRSAAHSALELIEAFTAAEQKPLETRLWRAGDVSC